MKAIRVISNVVLSVGAAFGVVALAVWLATLAGWVQPLVVISGSMRPMYEVGDLLIDRPVDTAALAAGDIVSLDNPDTGNLVTHRVVSVDEFDDGQWSIVLKGDDNDDADQSPYIVGDSVLSPAVRLPGLGSVMQTVSSPGVAIPLGIGLVACLGITFLRPDDETEDAHEKS